MDPRVLVTFMSFFCFLSSKTAFCSAFVATSRYRITSSTLKSTTDIVMGNIPITRNIIHRCYNMNLNTIKIRSIHLNSSVNEDDDANFESCSRIINVLCLHGKGNNAQSFQQTLQPFQQSLQKEAAAIAENNGANISFNFEYISAPFPMDGENSDNINNEHAFQWWTLPAGVRSFNAKEYLGFEQSRDIVLNELSSLHRDKKKQYDFVLGHSQGAILLSALMSSTDLLSRNANNDNGSMVKIGYILNGAAWPNPFTKEMESFQYQPRTVANEQHKYLKQPDVLFIVGAEDRINPPHGALRVRDSLISGGMTAIQTLHHSGGHAVPVKNKEALGEMVKFVMGAVMDNLN